MSAAPLPLQSPRWAELSHVYGPSDDIPKMLTLLASDPRLMMADADSVFSHLVSSLYHQCDPNTAAFAAFPHLVETAAAFSGAKRREILTLIGWLASAVDQTRVPIPDDLQEPYEKALQRARALVFDALGEDMEEAEEFRYLLGALAALFDRPFLASRVFELDALYQEHLEAFGEDWRSAPDF